MSEIFSASISEQLEALKQVTKLTGGLHEAQVLQLKMWPMVLFQNAVGSSFTWDNEKKVVAFKIDLPSKSQGKRKVAEFKERVGILNGWVQQLLGGEWIVVVDNGKVSMRGQRKIDAPPSPTSNADGKGSKTN